MRIAGDDGKTEGGDGEGQYPFRREGGPGQPQRQPAAGKTGEIDKGVEIAPHPLIRVAVEITPVVLVGESGRSNDGATGPGSQFGHLLRSERPIDGCEFVVLVFTHDWLSWFG